jgi:hypothetical protein
MSCNYTVKCERHFISKGFLGKVTIYFNQNGGQKAFDKDGCMVFKIPKEGNCYTSFEYKQGSTNPNETYKIFEVVETDSINQIFEFYENEYIKDTVNNKQRKYIYFHSSGYSAPNYTFEYYVDYGMNYKKHQYY